MKPIPSEFTGTRDQGPVGGLPAYHFKLLQRSGLVCLFQKSRSPKHPIFYEVVIVEPRPSKTFPNGVTTEAHESMPSPEKWGTSAWSLGTLEAAKEKFNKVVKQQG